MSRATIGSILLAAVTVLSNLGSLPAVTAADANAAAKSGPRVTIYDPSKAAPGCTVMSLVGAGRVELVDLQGQVLNTWQLDGVRARLLPNGNLLALQGTKWGRTLEQFQEFRYQALELDWRGETVWKYQGDDIVHHDIWRLDNGNTLFLVRDRVPPALKEQITSPIRRKQDIRSDMILEVTPAGRIAWQWRAHEHLDLNSCGRENCDQRLKPGKKPPKYSDWTHTNTAAPLPENKWFDQGHKEFKPGNIAILPRSWSTAMIVDRDSGQVVWKYAGDYKGGLSGSHEPHMIAKGLPGAGNILIFDNGVDIHSDSSFVLEINPVTKELVWVYDQGPAFYSRRRGSAQRLPNGNTLISEDDNKRCFEVTPSKQIVWEFVADFELNRCHRYPPDWCSPTLPSP